MESDLKKSVRGEVEKQQKQLAELSLSIHANPEEGFREFKACGWLCEYLESNSFCVEKGICEMPTAFRAVYGKGKPVVAFLAEYDALPGLGHACGHNLIAAIAAGAAVASRICVDEYGGSIAVIGTPAEEIHGGKILMAQRGAFSDIDMAMMVHPSTNDTATTRALACASLDIEFFGREAHAAAHPEDGINALEAMLLSFNAVNSLRQHTIDHSRIHGIITDGGQMVNVVPAHSAANLLVRADDEDYLEGLKRQVLDCFKGAATASGARLEYRWGDVQYAPMLNNLTMAHLYIDNMRSMGRDVELSRKDQSFGSTDMGNVSQLVPSIHTSIAIAEKGVSIHSPRFADAAASEEGSRGIILAAKALAMTTADILPSPQLVDAIKKEFTKNTA